MLMVISVDYSINLIITVRFEWGGNDFLKNS